MHEARLSEQLQMYDKDLLTDWVRPSHLSEHINNIKEYGSDRVGYTMGKYREYFEMGEIYNLIVKPAKGAGVRINKIEAYSDFEGRYYSGLDTVISAIVPAGKEFSHWIVNDEIEYGLELAINSSYVKDGKVEVTYMYKDKEENPKIIISKICSDGDGDFIMLYNPYKEDVDLQGYSITDDLNEPGKLILPGRQLRAGHSLKILGERNQRRLAQEWLEQDLI